MSKTLEGEIALVTGASRGIGKAIALALGKAGAEVIVNYNSSPDKAEEVCEAIRKDGGTASAIQFDVSNPEATKEAISGIIKEKKGISVLVNNAGITRDGLLARYKLEDWDAVLQTNLRSAFLTSQAVLRPMMKAQLHCGGDRKRGTARLLRGQGRFDRPYQIHGEGTGVQKHPGKQCRSGIHRYRHDQ